MLMTLIVRNCAQDFIQFYCGNDEFVKVIKIRKGGEFEGVVVRGECENSQGERTRHQHIRYATSGEERMWLRQNW